MCPTAAKLCDSTTVPLPSSTSKAARSSPGVSLSCTRRSTICVPAVGTPKLKLSSSLTVSATMSESAKLTRSPPAPLPNTLSCKRSSPAWLALSRSDSAMP
jgi:hypothetical protein